jgi:glycosyltransferase involved in cell wall biosynthesis
LTNGFGDLPDRLPGKSEARRLILHLGSIYGHRHIDTFLVALVKLVHSGRLEPSSFRVVFQGEVDSLQLAEAARIAPDLLQRKCVEFLPRSSWDEAQQLLWQSDLLLLFQGGQKLQVPAKFYEYLLTGIPMFAVAEKGALPDLIDSTASGIWVSPRDPETIAETFLRALRLPKHSPEEVSQRLSGQYHYRALTRQLSSLIREVTAKEEASPVAM